MPNITRTPRKSKAKDAAISKARERLNKKRTTRERATHWAHFWNICPKCGGDMFEQEVNSFFFDVCRKCNGVYLDKSELEFAMKFIDSEKLLKGIVRKAKKPATDQA